MPVLLKSSLNRAYAEALFNEISENRNQYFLFVGKDIPWGATGAVGEDVIPLTPRDTVAEEYTTMRCMIGYKKLDPSKIIFALPRIPWTSGTVYDAYDDTVELFDEDDPKLFYVVTSTDKIYKCLGVSLKGNPSTIEPSHTGSTAVTYGDDYTWKYLASIKPSLLPYELADYVPVNYVVVERDLVTDTSDTETSLQFSAQRTAVRGEITRVEFVSNGGVSAATYLGSEYGSRFSVGLTGSTAASASFGVGNYVTITSSTNTNQFTLPQSDIDKYVGYLLRIVEVSGSGTNPNDVNKYGIIHGVTSSSSEYTFTVRGEHEPFSFSYPGGAAQVYYDIIPHARISGDGSGAYCFPVLGVSGESTWRQITGVELIDGGENYSQAVVQVVSSKSSSDGTDSGETVHPTIRAILAPKGGHGSNILQELNVKDIIMIVDLGDDDVGGIPVGGEYRQFGLIKNPVLGDGSGVLAGKDATFYRDVILLYTGASYSTDTQFESNYFPGTNTNFIIGNESYASFPVTQTTPIVNTVGGETQVQIKVTNTGAAPVVWNDRLDNYILSFASPKTGFLVGERVTQSIPAGISIGALGGISYAFGITSAGTIVSAESKKLNVRVTQNAFVKGSSNNLQITGALSGVTALISGVSLAYGEDVSVYFGASAATEGGTAGPFFKMISISTPYLETASTPTYTGLTVLSMSRGSLADFTDTTWENGDLVQQGVSGSYLYDYASGTVYKWERDTVTNGRLYLSDTFGNFKTSTQYGASLAALNTEAGDINQGYVVSGFCGPQIDIHSGEIVYINNIKPINRIVGQEEQFRIRIGF